MRLMMAQIKISKISNGLIKNGHAIPYKYNI